MPPQQSDGLLDDLDQLFGFSAHDMSDPPRGGDLRRKLVVGADVVNRAGS
jgi:hypothetical protein